LAVGLWALISSIGLLIGAVIGGAAAPARAAELRRDEHSIRTV
jgi:gas vesicle protein